MPVATCIPPAFPPPPPNCTSLWCLAVCELCIDAQGAERKALLGSISHPRSLGVQDDLNAVLYFAISALPTETQSRKLLTFPSLNGSFYHQSQKNQQKKAQEGWNQDVKF